MSSTNRNYSNQNHKKGTININLGVVFFIGIFIYLVISFFSYIGQKKITGYQVVNGSLSENNIYRGIAIRQEKMFYADGAGYVNYYAGEGVKAGCGNLVYSLDATGELADLLADSEKTSLNEDELHNVKNEITNFKNSFQDSNFTSVYDFKRTLNSLIARYQSTNIMDNIKALNTSNGSTAVSLIRAETSGIVVYNQDGYENITIDSVSARDFEEDNYHVENYTSNRLVETGDYVYKMITSEDWYIAVEIDEITANRLADESYLQVRFLKTQTVSWAQTTIRYTGNTILLLLKFNNSMITFSTDRFIDLELVLDQETGLKIPNSSIKEKEFYIIPINFITKGANSEDGVLVDSYDEDGNKILKLLPVDIYYMSDQYYYVSKDCIEVGTTLYNPNGTYQAETLLDADVIRDNYETTEDSSVGVISNEVSEDDVVHVNEDGEVFVTHEGSEDSSDEEQISEDSTSSENSFSESNDKNTVEENVSENNSEEGEDNSSSNQTIQSSNQMIVKDTGTLIGVYYMNKGYADFRQITILYQNEEYAIIKPNTNYGLCEYDYIVLDASAVSDNDLVH